MVNVRKCITGLKHFVLILTLLVFSNDLFAQLDVSKIEGKQININNKYDQLAEYNIVIAPFKNKLDRDLDNVLATCPETLDKSKGKWQSKIGDLMAEITLDRANFVFKKRENKEIDACILNNGGIRSILPQGNVTTRTAFEIMPFENTAVVVALKGQQLLEFSNYFVAEKKPHPIAGITLTITNDNKVKDIKIKGQPLDLEKIYYVVTNDYLSNGGDKMDFFKKRENIYDIDYKLRNILIDYLKEVETVRVNFDVKVNQE
ncbi:MAG: 5'-nucleotidase [Limnohabitans sp.]|nr:5'-nucleotidase [Limnohabitans sp.]